MFFWMLAIYVDIQVISEPEENTSDEAGSSEFLQFSVPDRREKNSFDWNSNKAENSENLDSELNKTLISTLNETSPQTDPVSLDAQELNQSDIYANIKNEIPQNNEFFSNELMNSSASQFTNISSLLDEETIEKQHLENNITAESNYAELDEAAEKNETQGLKNFNSSSHFDFGNDPEIEKHEDINDREGVNSLNKPENKSMNDEKDEKDEHNTTTLSTSKEILELNDETSSNSSQPSFDLKSSKDNEFQKTTQAVESDIKLQSNASANEDFKDENHKKEDTGEEPKEIKSEELSPDISINSPDTECIPTISGLTKKQASIIYRYNKRKFTCGDDYDLFTFKNNEIRLDCAFHGKPELGLGNSPDQETIGSAPTSQSWREYSSPTDTGDLEFGFAKCGEFKKQAFLHNKLSESASKRAQEKRKSIEKALNLTSSKPLTVLTVVFDSVSRQHFYRTLTKTVDFMNQNIVKGKFSNKFAIYDFQIEHASGENTLPNVVPLLLGDSYDNHKDKVRGSALSNTERFKAIQEDKAIWKYFEAQGFVTMFGWETKWDYFSKMVGRKIFTDHVVSRLYFAASNLFGFKEDSDKERCLGNHFQHQYLLNYTKEFVKNYKDHNKFAYTHFSSGHESTGSVIKSMDTDLVNYINDILEYYSQGEEDLALILTSDHGLHVGPWNAYEGGRIENLLPYSFYILNKDLISRLGNNIHEILAHNTKHITSKYDMHVSLKYLARSPYEQIAKDSPLYSELKNKPLLKKAASIFVEKISDNRTCGDIGNPHYLCACHKFEEKNMTDYKELAENIGFLGIEQANDRIARDKMQYSCATLELEKVIGIKYEPIAGASDLFSGVYKINITIKNHPTFIFSIEAIAISEWEFGRYSRENFEGEVFRMSNLQFKGQKLRIQVQSIVRVDENNDYCIELGNGYINGKVSYCVCNTPKYYKTSEISGLSEKKLYENAIKLIYPAIGKDGSSCDETCMARNRNCQEWGLEIVNHFDLLNQQWNGISTYSIDMDNGYKDFKRLQIKGVDRGEMPGLRIVNKELRFIQANWTDLYCDTKISDIRPICSCSRYQVEF